MIIDIIYADNDNNIQQLIIVLPLCGAMRFSERRNYEETTRLAKKNDYYFCNIYRYSIDFANGFGG